MLIKTVLYENGVQTVVVFDTETPLWEQDVKVVEEEKDDIIKESMDSSVFHLPTKSRYLPNARP